MTRTAFAIAAGLLCALYGLRLSSSLRDAARRLHRWVEALQHLALIIGEESVSLTDALRLAGDGQLPPDRLLHAAADRLSASPMTSLPEVFRQLCPEDPERETLLRMSSRISRGSSDSRRLAAEQAASAIALLANQAEQRAARDARLWQTLGWTGGVCVTLLLL